MVLSGEVRERGTRDPVPYASVVASGPDGRSARTETDEKGAFTLELSPGSWLITILRGEWERFSIHETLAPGEHAAVRYFVDRRRYGRYETVVRAGPQREEVERRTLETEEIVKNPGTGGDALRSVENMPGVARAPFRRDLSRGLFGWLAYTLSSSERRDAPGLALRASDFDQTHVLVAVVSWKFARQWEAGVRVRYATGNPYTPVVSGIFDADHDVFQPIAGAKDSARVPAFTQLDVRIDHRWIFERWMLDAYLDLENATNRANVEAVLYNFDYTRTAQVTGLPLIPSLGLKGEF